MAPLLYCILLLHIFPTSECVTFFRKYRTIFPSQEELPAADLTLNLQENRLTFIPDGALCHMTALETLLMMDNRLESVGNLSCVGQSLRILNLKRNRISSIPEDALQGFVKLEQLSLDSNQLTAVTGLQHVANTLQLLGVVLNPLAGKFPSADMPPLNSLTQLDMSTIGLKGFPLGLQLPSLTTLSFGREDLNIMSGDVLQAALPNLEVLLIQNAQLRYFPDLRHVGQKLRVLNLANNPIRSVSKELLMKAPRLRELILSNTEVPTVPCLLGSSLWVLDLSWTPVMELPCVPPSLGRLDLRGTGVQRVEARRAVFMTGLRVLTLVHMPDLVELHDFMDSPHGKVLSVGSSPNLDLCKCEHAWIRRARLKGANVDRKYVTCGDGEVWNNINFTRFLDICDNSAFQGN
jgi:Leucine-rich repeat (LRR) protein